MMNPSTSGDNAAPSVHGLAAFRESVQRVLRVVRTIIGAPDYERYVQHMRAHHPECGLASRDEFMQQRLENRYSRPGSRCC
jgi:uncharacterized short protein YbdD (DUF466 family)